jgi:transposase
MLDQEKRTAILVLHGQDLSVRAIARACKASRSSVRTVIKSESAEVPRPERKEQAEPWRDEILALYKDCKGNLVRVHEKLVDQGAHVTYQALTGFCRRNEIGSKAAVPAGHYTFAAGQEMQNDTSPHRVKIAGKVRLAQCACLVLAHSRMCFMAYYPTFDRFWCKTFLTEAFRYFGGTCKECMIDNTHVVVAHGSGQTMVPVPEMEAFATRFGFRFRAHAIGHANRSAHVERKFRHIEQNFLAGREFHDWDDLNRQAREWCDQVNAKAKRDLHARPIDLFVQEKITLNPLPAYVPEVYRLHHRVVDVEGYPKLREGASTSPWTWAGKPASAPTWSGWTPSTTTWIPPAPTASTRPFAVLARAARWQPLPGLLRHPAQVAGPQGLRSGLPDPGRGRARDSGLVEPPGDRIARVDGLPDPGPDGRSPGGPVPGGGLILLS